MRRTAARERLISLPLASKHCMHPAPSSLFAALAMLALPLPRPLAAQAPSGLTAIEHVRVIDGTGRAPLNDQVVLVDGQTIRSIAPMGHRGSPAIPSGAKVIDAHGQTMMPGLINAHGHLALVDGSQNSGTYYTEPHVMAELRQYEHYGVLDVLSLGLNRDLLYPIRTQQAAGTLDGAAAFTADRGIGVPGGAPQIPHAADQLYQPRTPEEARSDGAAAAGRDANLVKVWVDPMHGAAPEMQPAIYTAVIDEAHKQHLTVAAHVYALADAKKLVAAGVDVLAHSVRDARVDTELIAAMKKRGVYYLPTLTVDESFFAFADHPELLSDPFLIRATTPAELARLRSDSYRGSVANDPHTAQHRQDFAMAKTNLKLMVAAGVRVGFGTDSGANPQRLPGYAEHRELQLMVEAGLTPLQALHCATAVNARLLGIDDHTGMLAPGLRADFLLLSADPAVHVANTRRMVSIWHNGYPGTPWATDRPETPAPTPR